MMDHRGLIHPLGENPIVFTTEYHYLLKKKGKAPNTSLIKRALESQIEGNILISDDKTEIYSHDNMTSWLCLAKLINYPNWQDWTFTSTPFHRVHPRDLCYYTYLKYPNFFTQFLLIIPAITMIISCLDTRVVPSGKLRTSGKLLTWIRLEALPNKFKLTRKLINAIIKWKFGSWSEIFKIYFDENHINYKLARDIYG